MAEKPQLQLIPLMLISLATTAYGICGIRMRIMISCAWRLRQMQADLIRALKHLMTAPMRLKAPPFIRREHQAGQCLQTHMITTRRMFSLRIIQRISNPQSLRQQTLLQRTVTTTVALPRLPRKSITKSET